MDVSIILVSYNTKDLTRNCLKSVFEKTEGLDFEIFVVDNNSHDGSPEMIKKEFPQVKLIENSSNNGFGAANNIAIKQSKAKYVFCLNTDTLLLDNSIKQFFDYMENHENIGACGGLLYNANNEAVVCGGNFPSLKDVFWKMGLRYIFKRKYKFITTTINSDEYSDVGSVDYISGANIFFRKSVLDKVGYFDENFFLYFEETDLCKRIRNFGYGVQILENVKIIHLEGASTTFNTKKLKMIKESEFKYFNKHHGKMYTLCVKLLYFVIYLFSGYLGQNKLHKDFIRDFSSLL